MAIATWPLQAQQQFVSLCGQSMERNPAVFSLVATVEKNKRVWTLEGISVLTHQLIRKERVCPAKVNKPQCLQHWYSLRNLSLDNYWNFSSGQSTGWA